MAAHSFGNSVACILFIKARRNGWVACQTTGRLCDEQHFHREWSSCVEADVVRAGR